MEKEIVEKEVWKIINKWISEKSFIDPTLFFPYAKMVVMITTKGKGKSHSALQYICKRLPDIEFNWIRNTAEELKQSSLVDSFTSALTIAGKDLEEYIVRSNGLYKVKKGSKFNERGILKGIFTTMNKSMNNASQNALKCDLIVYDEFINPEFTKNGLFTSFLKHCKTMIRKNKNARILLLGNFHTANSDILSGLGCELDWESSENQIYYNEFQSLLVVKLGEFDVAEMSEADDMIDRLGCYSEEYQRFQSGKAGVNNMWGVRSWEIHNIKDYYKPMFMYDTADALFCVGKVDDKADDTVKNKVYIKQVYGNEYNVPRLCYKAGHKKPYNTYIYDIKDYSTVKFLINNYNSGNLLFNNEFGKSEFQLEILPMLQILLEDEKNGTL